MRSLVMYRTFKRVSYTPSSNISLASCSSWQHKILVSLHSLVYIVHRSSREYSQHVKEYMATIRRRDLNLHHLRYHHTRRKRCKWLKTVRCQFTEVILQRKFSIRRRIAVSIAVITRHFVWVKELFCENKMFLNDVDVTLFACFQAPRCNASSSKFQETWDI